MDNLVMSILGCLPFLLSGQAEIDATIHAMAPSNSSQRRMTNDAVAIFGISLPVSHRRQSEPPSGRQPK